MMHPLSASSRLLLSIPFYFLWNWLAPLYLSQAPVVYQHLPFWHCVGFFLLIEIVRQLLGPASGSGVTARAWWGGRRRQDT